MTIRPANSPCAPEFGCSDTAANPVISQSAARAREDLLIAGRLLHRHERMQLENSGQVIGSISDAAFSFIVHEPSGIIDVSRPMSFRSRLRMYRIISVSE